MFRNNAALGGAAGAEGTAGVPGGSALGGALVYMRRGQGVFDGITADDTATLTADTCVGNAAVGRLGPAPASAPVPMGAAWFIQGHARPPDASRPLVTGTTIANNLAQGGADADGGSGGTAEGGGLYASVNVSIAASSVTGNRAVGGASGSDGSLYTTVAWRSRRGRHLQAWAATGHARRHGC